MVSQFLFINALILKNYHGLGVLTLNAEKMSSTEAYFAAAGEKLLTQFNG